jgi:hypothetical protein
VAGAIAENGMAVSELLRRRIGAYFGSEARGLSRPLLPTKSISPATKKGWKYRANIEAANEKARIRNQLARQKNSS